MKSVTNAARQKELNSKKSELKAQQLELKRKLAQKYGDRFKAIKRKDDTVVISKEAKAAAELAQAGKNEPLRSDDPNSEVNKSKIKSMMNSGAVQFNDKERKALEEILG